MRVLTKSRFKLGLECPNKLYYTQKEAYIDSKKSDFFLEALAQGGFQVEELARMHFPDGVLIEGNDWDYKLLWHKTQELLKLNNVIIFEAAFLINNLFVRTDILVKKGNKIDLIEVKSKSFNPNDEYLFVGKRGGMVSNWKSYLFDVTFQKYVMQCCFPDWNIRSFIMMADKTKQASIDGLNQLFRISKKAGNRTGIVRKVDSIEQSGSSILGKKNITEIVSKIENNTFRYYPNLTFIESVTLLKNSYLNDSYANWPCAFSPCKGCEFKATDKELIEGYKSGFKECFTKQLNWNEDDFKEPNILDIHFFLKGKKVFADGFYFKKDLTKEKIGLKTEPDCLTTSHRQWLQIEKEVNNDKTVYFDQDCLKNEIEKWNYPLHFIDFETSAVALPFNKELRPYEQVAFQFSHHTYHQDGRVAHANEYINNVAGYFPNFDFVRHLKTALEKDNGTIFRYSHHENTILNAIYFQLLKSEEPDREELIKFIQGISHSKNDSAHKWCRDRDMVDLCEIEKRYYYNPFTKGSNSIKAVLPATLNSNPLLKEKYSKPLSEINVTSKNFSSSHVWLQIENDVVKNPYDILPSVFDNWDEAQLEITLSEIDGIKDGGAALMAYSKLQYTDMEISEVNEITKALLKYCELDTLAMVMIFEHFKEITD